MVTSAAHGNADVPTSLSKPTAGQIRLIWR